MLDRSPNIWHSLGYTAERARSATRRGGGVPPEPHGDPLEPESNHPAVSSSLSRFAVATAGSLVVRTFERWLARKSPSLPWLLRGAAAGIGAAGVLAAARYLVESRPRSDGIDSDLLDELLEGAGHGLVYAAIIEPNIPGPPVLRGLLVGSAEHIAAPWGGLLGPLQGATPHAKVPGLHRLLSPLDVGERPIFDHLLYATLLAILYGSRPKR